MEWLTWAVYNGVYVPGDEPALSGHHNRLRIIAGTALHFIFSRSSPKEYCGPCAVSTFNAKQTTQFVKQQGHLQPSRARPPAASANMPQRSPTVQSMVNVPPQVASSHSTGGAQVVSLDFDVDTDEEDTFNETSRRIMMRCFPIRRCLDSMWQMTKWLQVCKESFDEEDIYWWLLLPLPTDVSDTASKEFARCLLTAWKWAKKVSNMPIFLLAPTVLYIGQFLERTPQEGDCTPWLLVYVHVLQCVGEATDGRTW